jgi:RNA polymerase sigma-70 factor (ECF subfamily)
MERGAVELAIRGDRRAFEVLATQAIDRLFGAAFLILHDRTLAEDAVQETLIRTWRDLPRLRDPDRFDAWIHRVLAHACLDLARHERQQRHTVELPDFLADDGTPEEDIAARDAIGRGLSRLTQRERTTLVLRFFLRLSVPEIADAMGIPEGTAKSRLHHAQQAMRAAVDADSRIALRGELA